MGWICRGEGRRLIPRFLAHDLRSLTHYTNTTPQLSPNAHSPLCWYLGFRQRRSGGSASRAPGTAGNDTNAWTRLGVDRHLFSEVYQWKWPPSCHLETDKTQLEASQLRKRGPGGQGRSMIMALQPDRSAGNSDGWQCRKSRGTQRWGFCGPAELPVAFDPDFLTNQVALMGSSSCIPAT